MKQNNFKPFLVFAMLFIALNANAQEEVNAVKDTSVTATKSDTIVSVKKDTAEKIQRFNISAGGFFPIVSTTMSFDTKRGGIGTEINMEEALGLTSHPKVFRIDGIYQMTRRSSFKATYFQMDRKQTWTIDKDIKIRDTTFYVDATLKYHFNMQYFGLNYGFSAIANKNFRAGFTTGLRYLYFDAKFEVASNNVNDGVGGGIGVPVLLFGFNASGNILPRLIGRYDFEFFQLSLPGFKGLVYENRISLEYYFTKNLGLGGSFTSLLYNVKDVPLSNNFNGGFKYTISGLSLFAAFKF